MMPPGYVFVMGGNTKNANISGSQEINAVKVLNPPQIQHLAAIRIKLSFLLKTSPHTYGPFGPQTPIPSNIPLS